MKKFLATGLAACTLALPLAAQAFPFGGMIGQIVFCYNDAIYASLGPPNGGPFIWTPSTQTYQFGPPSHTGQWLLGLAAPPYYCLVSIQPIIVWSGTLMTMEGSSGGAAPGLPGGGLVSPSPSPTSFPPPTPNPSPPPSQPPSIGYAVVSEVYYQADASHGGKNEDEWIEIYNPLSTPLDLSRWTIRSQGTSQTIPNGTKLAPKSFLVFAGSANVRSLWTIPSSVQVIVFPSAFAGFTGTGDHVYLQDNVGTRVDAVSYGSDSGAFSPPVSGVQLGHSIARGNLTADSNTSSDWIDSAAPTPGR